MLQTRRPFLNLLDLDFLNDLNNNGLPALKSVLSMKVDIIENDKEFIIHSDIPGVNKEDIDVGFKDGVLTITVESKTEQEKKEGYKILRMERTTSKKSRSFNFDTSLDEEQINGKYENGVLILVLPKKKVEEKTTKVSIS